MQFLAVVVNCAVGVVLLMAGMVLLPGSQYAYMPIGKLIWVDLYGNGGYLLYGRAIGFQSQEDLNYGGQCLASLWVIGLSSHMPMTKAVKR